MGDSEESRTVADLLGPWTDPGFESGLIERCRRAWNKPIRELTNEELATFLRQRIAVEQILSIAKKRVDDGVDDDTEIFDGELRAAVESIETTQGSR